MTNTEHVITVPTPWHMIYSSLNLEINTTAINLLDYYETLKSLTETAK